MPWPLQEPVDLTNGMEQNAPPLPCRAGESTALSCLHTAQATTSTLAHLFDQRYSAHTDRRQCKPRRHLHPRGTAKHDFTATATTPGGRSGGGRQTRPIARRAPDTASCSCNLALADA
jgi:phosphatidylserine/phosphatidylglycerophosphate/cardiolipin synthase-like enzyme